MTQSPKRTFSSDFRLFFLRGLVVLLPSILTLWIVVKAYQFVDTTIAEPINRGIRLALVNSARVSEPLRRAFDPTPEALDQALQELPPSARPDADRAALRVELRARRVHEWWASRWYMDFIGLVVAIVAVYIAGRLLGGFFGRRLYRRLERFITALPVFKQVYPYVKQVVDFLFGDETALKFNRVVVTEYPRRGIWSMGFMTGSTMRAIAEQAGDSITVFVPSSPTPFTGYTITVPRNEVIELPISVEDALRFVVSGGVLVPEHQRIENPAEEAIEPVSGQRAGGQSRPETGRIEPKKEARDRGGDRG